MQVHKENIDKVPNSLKGRDDITLEICGMDNIPEEDLIEHEKQKGLFEPDDDKETTAQQSPSPMQKVLPPGTIHGPLPHMPPPPPSHFMMPPPPMAMMGMMPFWNPMMMPNVNMASASSHAVPPPLPPVMGGGGQPPSLMSIPPPPLPPSTSAHIGSSHQHPPPPPLPPQPQHSIKPLFPSAANLDNQYNDTVTRKSLDENTDSYTNAKKTKIEAVGSGSKIIHPDEDISLVS
jgi:hypothetical protein